MKRSEKSQHDESIAQRFLVRQLDHRTLVENVNFQYILVLIFFLKLYYFIDYVK